MDEIKAHGNPKCNIEIRAECDELGLDSILNFLADRVEFSISENGMIEFDGRQFDSTGKVPRPQPKHTWRW